MATLALRIVKIPFRFGHLIVRVLESYRKWTNSGESTTSFTIGPIKSSGSFLNNPASPMNAFSPFLGRGRKILPLHDFEVEKSLYLLPQLLLLSCSLFILAMAGGRRGRGGFHDTHNYLGVSYMIVCQVKVCCLCRTLWEFTSVSTMVAYLALI